MDGLLGLPTHLRRRLADALDSGALVPPCTPAALKAVLGMRDGADRLADTLGKLHDLGMPGTACAAWIRMFEEATGRSPRPDLVWSGPEVPGVHARDTRRVYEELMGTAERSVWASSFVYFDGPKAFEVLARRMDQVEKLQVTLLLNIQRKWGDTTVASDLVRRYADRFWGADWPGQARPRVFYDPRALEPDGPRVCCTPRPW